MNLNAAVELLKTMNPSSLQEVGTSYEQKQRDPRSVALETAVNSKMAAELQKLTGELNEAKKNANGIKPVGVEEAIKELLALQATHNKA